MKTSLTKGMDKDSAQEMEQLFKGAARLRKRVIDLLNEKSSTADKLSLSDAGYENPNWAYRQADIIGYRRAISELSSLLRD